MADPFLGEIRMFSFSFAPLGWALCNGQVLPINQNQALFNLFGTTFGGNGQTTFALPNMQGRVAIHSGNGHTLGETGGQYAHTLSIAETPMHTHPASAANTTPAVSTPANNTLAGDLWNGPQNLAALNPASIANTGGSQPHENRQPFLTISYCVALTGIYPSP